METGPWFTMIQGGADVDGDGRSDLDALRYLADYFDTVEINSSFYGAPRPDAAKKWLESVASNPNFCFTAKLFQSFMHQREPAPNDEREF